MIQNDTIAAIATPSGVGAIGVIRISGQDAIKVCQHFFKGKNLEKVPSHTIQYGYIVENEIVIDEVMISVFKAPRSFTSENSVEISCHGSPYIMEKVMQVILKSGVRLAEPGEFTMRAFLNGRIDLSQAEAVADLIASNSDASRKVALQQMRGGFSSEIAQLREELIMFTSLIELELDFGEEDVEFADRNKLIELIDKLQSKLQPLIHSFQLGNVIKNGVNTVIAGRPNAGKSTLLNALLNEERAIVSDIAGTTRDTIEEVLNIKGIQFRLIDTAGIRDAQDKIESIGVDLALSKIKQSSVLVYVFDVLALSPEELWSDLEKLSLENQKLIVVANKMDLNPYTKPENFYKEGLINTHNLVTTSAINKMNIEALKSTLYSLVSVDDFENQTIVTNLRHFEALKLSSESLADVKQGIETGMTGDLISLDLKRALIQLGNITGAIDVDTDILGAIFSKFCIGK
jgi:tRNA modification GTPase